MRGYVLGKRDDLLAPYNIATAVFPSRVDGLRRLVSDNPIQTANADVLVDLLRRRLESARRRVELRRDHSLEEILPTLTDGTGQKVMDAARAQIEKMRGIETDLLAARTQRFERSGRNLQIAFGFLLLLATLLVAVFFVLVRNDFTQRRAAAAMVEANERRFRSLLESAPDSMILADTAGIITLVNSAFERLFGYPRQEAVGRPLRELLAERGTDVLPAILPGPPVSSANDAEMVLSSPTDLDPPARLPTQRELSQLQIALPAGRYEGVRKDGSRFPADLTFNPLELAEAGGGTEATSRASPAYVTAPTSRPPRTSSAPTPTTWLAPTPNWSVSPTSPATTSRSPCAW